MDLLTRFGLRGAAAALCLLGLVLIGLGGYVFLQEQLFLQGAQKATAVVTGNDSYSYTGDYQDMGTQHYYCSEFQFQASNGETVTFQEDDGRGAGCGDLDQPPDYQVGQEVVVYYDQNDPAGTAQDPKSVDLPYTTVKLLVGAGVLCFLLVIGGFGVRVLRQKRGSGRFVTG
jgi:Protein of unknown function (DUF3592)